MHVHCNLPIFIFMFLFLFFLVFFYFICCDSSVTLVFLGILIFSKGLNRVVQSQGNLVTDSEKHLFNGNNLLFQVHYIHQLVQSRLCTEENPLVDLYNCLRILSITMYSNAVTAYICILGVCVVLSTGSTGF